MDDRLIEFLQLRMRTQPRSETMFLTPNPERAGQVKAQWQKRMDETLFSGLPDDAAAHTHTDWTPRGTLIEAMTAMARHSQKQRLAERLKQDPTIYYLSSQWLPGTSDGEIEVFWWEDRDVLLVPTAYLPQAKQQFESLGITLIEVDEIWWQRWIP